MDTLARKYAGANAKPSDINAYTKGWSSASGGTLTPASVFHIASTDELLALGKAMFAHEIGRPGPLKDDQVRFGIDQQRTGSMPS
jgi:hypothetical protein